jgi:N-acyl-D-amino-acid deacylase
VLFDPATIRDVADFNDPQRAAEGIDGVWVNGVLILRRAGEWAQGRAVSGAGRDLRDGFE